MNTWSEALGEEKQQPYFRQILDTVKAERESGQVIYPPAHDVFNAFKATEFNQVKVVVLGQDPYHNEGQAHGLSFSVRPDVQIPPSLQNIYKELAEDIAGFQIPNHGYLQHWAEQGVLLLNAVLTVRAHQAHSHARLGWETFTDKVIRQLADEREHLVFILWGSHAQKRRVYRPHAPFGDCFAASIAAFGLSRLFRQQTFFPYQRLFAGTRAYAD